MLREVISDVIRRHVKNPHLPELITITRVDVSADLHFAKVFVSVLGDAKAKEKAIEVLQSAAGLIAQFANKQMTVRYFPDLTFYIDEELEQQLKIQSLLSDIEKERNARESDPSSTPSSD